MKPYNQKPGKAFSKRGVHSNSLSTHKADIRKLEYLMSVIEEVRRLYKCTVCGKESETADDCCGRTMKWEK